MKSIIKKLLKWMALKYDKRIIEFNVTKKYIDIENPKKILDIGCGNGKFLELYPDRAIGIDINPENISYLISKRLMAETGSATDLKFDDNSFDLVHCSHVMQIFNNLDAHKFISEAYRVTKADGFIVISTLNWFKDFWQHPENSRPYPPDVFSTYGNHSRESSNSPMFQNLPRLEQVDIWLRRRPLIFLRSYKYKRLNYIFTFLNGLQYLLFCRNYFSFDAYIIKLKVIKD
jgi:SAM-dependent methyltransferase